MNLDKSNIDRLFNDARVVAFAAPAANLFGMFARSLRLPTAFAALVTRAAGDRLLVEPGGTVESDDVAEVVFLRTSPLELSFERAELATKDAYLCHARVTLQLAIIPEQSEAESFRASVLTSRRIVNVDAIARRIEPTLMTALAALAQQEEVEHLVDGKCGERAARAIGEALATPCFQAGLKVIGNAEAAFDSEGLREVRAGEARTARRMDEHAARQPLEAALAEARARRLDELESTLMRLQQLASKSPDATLPDLLRSFSEAQRAELYAALFESQEVPRVTGWVVVASGGELLFFAPDAPSTPARRVSLTGRIGPLRSIQSATLPDGSRRLLAGAARGVYELDAEGSSAKITYAADAPGELHGGVNAAALHGKRLYATHSELGLVSWDRADPHTPWRGFANLTRGARTVRNVQSTADRVLFSVDDRVVAFAPADHAAPTIYTGSSSAITALLADNGDLYAGNAEGQIIHWPDRRTTSPRVLHGGSRRPAEGIALLSEGGVARLFFTDTTLAVFARVVGDTFTCRYEAGGQTLQRVEVAPDLIVAIDDPRHRLVLWSPSRPDRPEATINVARLTQHSIQDVALTPLES